MRLDVFRSLWGVKGSWQESFPRIRAAGFDGVELRVPTGADQRDERERLADLLRDHGFACIAEVSACGYVVPRRDATPAEHLADLRRQIPYALELAPRFINGYHGCDAWGWDDQRRFFAGFLELEREFGVAMSVETHRGRSLFNPWITRDLLAEFPLKLTCDFSHWVVVCERLLDSELDVITRCAERCWHIHARVGYDQGPQVPDPRAPEYAAAVAAHERWWDLCWRTQAGLGRTAMSLTPEFGDEGYLHHLPYTDVPVADLWDICTWQGARQRQRFAAGGWRGGDG
jgi:sugar phosphate isomerase/epimerase